MSVYADQSRPHGEEWPLLQLTDATPEEDLYGARKAACESIVMRRFGDRALIPRPGLTVGRRDLTDRFTYWPRRSARGGTVLGPGRPEDPLQFIDVRDLADWTLSAAERGLSGTFNVTGEIVDFGDFIDACRAATASDPDIVWVPSETLLALGLDPWMGIPLWIAAPGWDGANRIDITRARDAGLTFRPLEDTIRESWAWDRERRAPGQGPSETFTREWEQEVLNSLT